jgi:glycosyltransferase involved in cell wall biosynthesis
MIVSISKVTDDIIRNVAPGVRTSYLPHAVDPKIFQKRNKEEVEKFVKDSFGDDYDPNKKIFFWNNRNARRKQSGSLIFWFKTFLDKIGHDKACLVMHTDVYDQNGQNLEEIVENLGLNNGQVIFSTQKVNPDVLSYMYNMAHCTINVSDAEGFGLATLESLSCETPILVNMTGGLQEQVTDGENWFGIGMHPTSKAIIGSQDIPYIYEDRLSEQRVVESLEKMYNLSEEEHVAMGRLGREHVLKNYNFKDFCAKWDEVLTSLHVDCGSWDNRKNYNSWTLKEM